MIRYFENGKPTDTEERFLELLQPMTKKVAELYPGWRVRMILDSFLMNLIFILR